MYEIIIRIHYIVSSIFFIIASLTIVWAVVGWIKDKKSTLTYKRLSFAFIHFLYIQLLTGIALYFFLKPDVQSVDISLDEAMMQTSLRFWAIEHVSLMLFALILSLIGRLIIKQISSDRKKFRAATFFYGVSFIVVLISATMAIFR